MASEEQQPEVSAASMPTKEEVIEMHPTDAAIAFVTSHAALGVAGDVKADIISGGNMNYAWRISGDGDASVFVKNVPPFMKVVGPVSPLTKDRLGVEIRSLQYYHAVAPGSVPEVYHADLETGFVAMQDLKGWKLLQEDLMAGVVSVQPAESVGRTLGIVFAKSGAFAASAEEVEKLRADFSNQALVDITRDYVFTFPYEQGHPMNRFSPAIAETVERLQADASVKERMAAARNIFTCKFEGVVHGDLHTGSVMVDGRDDGCKIIDGEFAFYGPLGFDVGLFIAGYVFPFVRHVILKGQSCQEAREILAAISAFWGSLSAAFKEALADKAGVDADEKLREILREGLQLGSAELMRRIIGTSHREDIETITPEELKSKAECLVLLIGQRFLCDGMDSVEQLVTVLAECIADLP